MNKILKIKHGDTGALSCTESIYELIRVNQWPSVVHKILKNKHGDKERQEVHGEEYFKVKTQRR